MRLAEGCYYLSTVSICRCFGKFVERTCSIFLLDQYAANPS